MRRGLLAAPVLFAVLAGPAGAAGVRLTVNGDDASATVLSEARIDAARDVPVDTPATLRYPDGREERDIHGGTSVAAVVELAGIPREYVDAVAVARANASGQADLSGDEVRDGFAGDPSGELRFATVFPKGTGSAVLFFRPLRNRTDANVADFISASSNLQMAVTTTGKTAREVTADVSDETPGPGQAVTFDASVSNPSPGVSFTYRWDFGDGSSGTGARPADHRYSAGAYRAKVTAVGSDGSVGFAPVALQVGSPSGPAPTATASPGGGGPSTGDGPGAAGSGGGAATGGGAGSDKSQASGPSTGGRGQGTRGKGRQGGDTSGSDAGVRQDATATPTAAATATTGPRTAAPSRAPAAPSPGDTSSSAADEPARRPGRAAPDRRKETSRERARGAAPIDGVLLAGQGSAKDVAKLLASASPSSGERAASRRGGGGGPALGGWAVGSGLLVVLLGVGAVREGGIRLRLAVKDGAS